MIILKNSQKEIKNGIENALQNAQTAINNMVDDPINNGYFRRVYHQELFYQQWNGKSLKPPNISSGQVWNYQYVLPFILKAIAIYLTASGIAEPTIEKYRRRYGGEIRTWAESLQQIHDEITNQIISIRPPKLYEFCPPNEAYAVPINSEGGIIGGGSEYGPNIRIPYLRYFCDRQGYLEEGKWNQVGRIYGAVEVSSAVAVEKVWPAIECPQPIVLRHPFFQEGYEPGTYELVHPFPPPEQWLRDIYAKHVIATLKATKDLYLYLGLLSLWRIIGKLRAIAGLNVIPPHPMSYWSLRQVDNVVGLAKLGRLSTASTGNRISVRTIANALGVAPPFSLRNSVLAQP